MAYQGIELWGLRMNGILAFGWFTSYVISCPSLSPLYLGNVIRSRILVTLHPFLVVRLGMDEGGG